MGVARRPARAKSFAFFCSDQSINRRQNLYFTSGESTTKIRAISSDMADIDANANTADRIAEYKEAASGYAASVLDEVLWIHTDTYTFKNFILKGKEDRLKGASVLDLACGSGQFSRLAVELGASRVVGVDISPDQIELARRDSPKSIQFIVRDVLALTEAEELGEFDVVLGSYLFSSSQSRNELKSMLKATSSRLKKGGRLVGVCECWGTKSKGLTPRSVFGEVKGGPMFSWEVTPIGKDQQIQDFCPRKYVFRNSDQSTFSVTGYPVHEETLQEMLTDTGFCVNSMGLELTCSPEGRELFPPDFIKSLIEEYGKGMLYFDAIKP